MILNTTYPDKKIKQLIESKVGASFSIFEKIKMKGIGSSKLQIIEASRQIQKLIGHNHDTAYSNIELRKTGIVVGFSTVGRKYALCIPYYQLSIYYNGGLLTISGPENHLKAKAPFNGQINKRFLSKLLKLKAEFIQNPKL